MNGQTPQKNYAIILSFHGSRLGQCLATSSPQLCAIRNSRYILHISSFYFLKYLFTNSGFDSSTADDASSNDGGAWRQCWSSPWRRRTGWSSSWRRSSNEWGSSTDTASGARSGPGNHDCTMHIVQCVAHFVFSFLHRYG